MNICLICDKPIATSFSSIVVGAVLLGYEVVGLPPMPRGECECLGSRCNLCHQVYQGLAGDCLCTNITAEDYKQAGVALGRRAA